MTSTEALSALAHQILQLTGAVDHIGTFLPEGSKRPLLDSSSQMLRSIALEEKGVTWTALKPNETPSQREQRITRALENASSTAKDTVKFVPGWRPESAEHLRYAFTIELNYAIHKFTERVQNGPFSLRNFATGIPGWAQWGTSPKAGRMPWHAMAAAATVAFAVVAFDFHLTPEKPVPFPGQPNL